MDDEDQRSFSRRHLAEFLRAISSRIRELPGGGGLIGPDMVALEREMAELVEEVPELGPVFEDAKEHPRTLSHIVELARYLVDKELGRDGAGWEEEYFRRSWLHPLRSAMPF